MYPPSTETDEQGNYIRPQALCYVPEYLVGIRVLTLYHEGRYKPGDVVEGMSAISATMQKVKDAKTFATVYDEFYRSKYEDKHSRKYSEQAKQSTSAAFKNSADLHNMPFSEINHDDLQKVIDNLPLKHASKELLVSLYRQMYKYAIIHRYVERDESFGLQIKTPDDDEHGVPFSLDELKILWANREKPIIRMVLIMIYSGFRISECINLEVNLEEKYFRGGVKTEAGKDRIVPIHSGIYPLIQAHIATKNEWWVNSSDTFRNRFIKALKALGMNHTPHDTRHTFSMLCEMFNVAERDQKRMLGHKFTDVTNKVYGHRLLEDLRNEIEKIQIIQ